MLQRPDHPLWKINSKAVTRLALLDDRHPPPVLPLLFQSICNLPKFVADASALGSMEQSYSRAQRRSSNLAESLRGMRHELEAVQYQRGMFLRQNDPASF
jgi:hypothetical protein